MTKVSIITGFNIVSKDIDLEIVLSEIKEGKCRKEINSIQEAVNSNNKDLANSLKRKLLPGLTVSGTFKETRKNETLNAYNKIIILDFDDIPKEKFLDVIVAVIACPYTMFSFKSPSGKGYKIGVKVNTDANYHNKALNELYSFFESFLGITGDRKAGYGVAALTFYSYDPDLYYNPQSLTYEVISVTKSGNFSSLEEVKDKLRKKGITTDSSNNAYCFYAGIYAKRASLPMNEVVDALALEVKVSKTQIERSVGNAYELIKNKTGGDSNTKNTATESPEAFLKQFYEFKYNQANQRTQYKLKGSNEDFIEVTDFHCNSIFRNMISNEIEISLQTLKALLNSDMCEIVDPFKDYLLGVPKWDEQTDYISQLGNTVQTNNQEFWQEALKKFLVGIIASLLDFKVNHIMLVLSGSQGKGKSTWIKTLVPDLLSKYFYEGKINPNNKDSEIQLSECMLIIINEVDQFTKTETSSLKEIITKSSIRVRRPYAASSENLPRRASFVGSVNGDQIYRDSSGSRRYLSFIVKDIDYQHNIDIDCVYSQALHLYRSGFKYYFTPDEVDKINSNNEIFELISAEEETILSSFKIPYIGNEVQYLNATEIIEKINSKNISIKFRPDLSTKRLIGQIMNKHGFERVKKNQLYKYKVTVIEDEETPSISRLNDVDFFKDVREAERIIHSSQNEIEIPSPVENNKNNNN